MVDVVFWPLKNYLGLIRQACTWRPLDVNG